MQTNVVRRFLTLVAGLALLCGTTLPALAQSVAKKPNILVIWGDDIGIHDISAHNLGLMSCKTPDIDRISKAGALFTDAYEKVPHDSGLYLRWYADNI